jgi:hypothetical protein
MSIQADWPWIVLLLIILVWFSIFEARAWNHLGERHTASRFIAQLGKSWPLSIWLWGLLMGGLAVHFFWPWCSNPLGNGIG